MCDLQHNTFQGYDIYNTSNKNALLEQLKIHFEVNLNNKTTEIINTEDLNKNETDIDTFGEYKKINNESTVIFS